MAGYAIYAPTIKCSVADIQAQRVSVRAYAAKREILPDGQPSTLVGTLRAGWAYSYKKMSDGHRFIQSVLVPGDFLTVDLLYIGGYPLPYGVNALTDATVCWFDAQYLRDLLRRDGDQQKWTEYWTAYYLASLHARASVISDRDARGRLAQFFIELTDRLRYRRAHRDPSFEIPLTAPFFMSATHQLGYRMRYPMESFDMPLTQAQIADCLGLTTEHANRILSQLAKDGVLELKEKQLRILDEDELTRIACDG